MDKVESWSERKMMNDPLTAAFAWYVSHQLEVGMVLALNYQFMRIGGAFVSRIREYDMCENGQSTPLGYKA